MKITLIRLIAFKYTVYDSRTLSCGKDLTPKAYKSSRRNKEFQSRIALCRRLHIRHLAHSVYNRIHNHSGIIGRHINRKTFYRLTPFSVNFLVNYNWI